MKKILTAAAFFAGTIAPVFAGTSALTFWNDNDMRWSDKYYTSHQRISFSTTENLPEYGFAFFSLGQEIYAPKERYTPAAPEKDHPYCGFAYLSAGMGGADDNVFFSYELQAGVVGPAALGREVQNEWHHFIDIDRLSGWDSQVKNQVGINLLLECGGRRMLAGTLRDGWASDLTLRGFASAGTVRDVFSIGAQWRWGKNLPADLGYRSMRQGTSGIFVPKETKDYWYLFADFHADAIFYDVTMGGELLRHYDDSTDITPYPFSFELTLGFSAFVGKRFLISVGESFRRKDFVSADKLYFAYTGVRISCVF